MLPVICSSSDFIEVIDPEVRGIVKRIGRTCSQSCRRTTTMNDDCAIIKGSPASQ